MTKAELPQSGERATVLITDLTSDGRGVARLESGRVVMIPSVIPGDEAIIAPARTPGRETLFAHMLELVTPSPHRIAHPCPHYVDGCPASPLGAMEYAAALAWKREHLIQTLRRIGKLEAPEVREVISSPQRWNYRDRIELHLVPVAVRWRPAYLSFEGPIPISDCHLASPPVRGALRLLARGMPNDAMDKMATLHPEPRLLIRDNGVGGAVIILFLGFRPNPDNLSALTTYLDEIGAAGWQVRQTTHTGTRQYDSSIIASRGDTSIIWKYRDLSISLPPTAFTQVNLALSDTLIDSALESLPKSGQLWDLYGGFGAFAIAYCSNAGRAMVVEASSDAVSAGSVHAKKSNLNISFVKDDLSRPGVFSRMKGSPDAVILDPPRAGIHAPVTQWLNKRGPGRVVYVSCHPAALARDLKLLTSYRAEYFQPLDLFPQTPDLETVAVLGRV